MVLQLKAIDVGTWTTVFGAELLWSALPFIILLSSLANERIDDDLSRHIGLNSQGAHIVAALFRHRPAHGLFAILTGLLFTVAGVISVVASLQVLYERLYEQDRRGWRDLPRYLVWVLVLFALLVADGSVSRPERQDAGVVVQALLTLLLVFIFFAWTIHFLLAGRVPWRRVVRPALVTSLLWIALAFLSSAYFSSVVVDDSHTYGTIGVAFTFLTWFIMIGVVIVLGGTGGVVWQRRAEGTGPLPAPP
jgi:membrane protein